MLIRPPPGEVQKSNLRLFVVVWPIVLIIVAQALLASFSLQMVSSLRAYVTGESLWSKGQHDAIYYLNRYISSGDAQYFLRYEEAIALPMGDRTARLALEAEPPQFKLAVAGFVAGGNHPDDIQGLIWLFRNFSWFSYMGAAISDWRLAESALQKVVALGDSVTDLSTMDQAHRDAATLRLDELNDLVTPLTTRFSRSLGEGARFVQTALLAANIAIAALFVGITFLQLNSFLKHRRAIETELEWHASHDDLTGLPSRRSFERYLGELMQVPHTPHAVMFIDLDQFKVVNDAGGHAAGDGLLRRVAEVLPRELRAEDLLARLGGDEFGVILPDCSPDTALAIAQRLRAAVQEIKFVWEGQPHGVGASIGLVYLGGQNLTLAQALRAADIACYIAKEKGRNRVHVYAPDDLAQAGLASEMGWVQRLQRALELNRFQLHAQSIVATAEAGRKGEHLELLLRLDDGDGRLTPPGAFIPAAERFGLMPAIDRWVVHTALEIIASRRAEFYGPAARTYAINLSGITLTDETFLPFLRAELASSGVPPEVLCFEITETSAIANLERAAEFIEAMQAMGSRFALDDFGVGMSSLTYLKRLPVDYLKIDGSFVRDMLEDKSDYATVQTINQIAHMSGKKTIAEFVETPEILDALRVIGVDYAQGYAIDRPSIFRKHVTEPIDIRKIA